MVCASLFTDLVVQNNTQVAKYRIHKKEISKVIELGQPPQGYEGGEWEHEICMVIRNVKKTHDTETTKVTTYDKSVFLLRQHFMVVDA